MKLPILFAFAALASPVAAADLPELNSHDPEMIARHLQSTGYRAELTKDSEGDPMIRTAGGGTKFELVFYNCKDHRACGDLAFHAGYNFDSGKEPTLASINSYNRNFRFAYGTIDDEKDPHLRMDVFFVDGRLGSKAFDQALEVWIDCMGDFEKHVGW